MAEWRRQRDTYRQRHSISRLRRGFAAFYLNRCNRSGIVVNGGPIGGIKQSGTWKIDARYNKRDLIRRIRRIAALRGRIHVSGRDGIKFLGTVPTNTFLFIDPPYFMKGKTLYLDALNEPYHMKLAVQLKSYKERPWVLTYDDCAQIRNMYRGWARIRPFSLRYVANQRQRGDEIIITPKWMKLPGTQSSDAINW